MGKSDYKVEGYFLSYWTNFAKYGNPNSEGLPQWNPSNQYSVYLNLNKKPEMQEGFDQEICDTLE
jgi:carboxylesterase type B